MVQRLRVNVDLIGRFEVWVGGADEEWVGRESFQNLTSLI